MGRLRRQIGAPVTSGVAHIDGWIVASSGKQLTELLGTRRLARLEAKRLRAQIVGRCSVYKARQIWKPEPKRTTTP